jgi:phosphodiester glycosidase
MGAHAASLGDRLSRPRRARQFVHELSDGCATTVYVATYSRRLTHLQHVRIEPGQPLREWARAGAVPEAIAGGEPDVMARAAIASATAGKAIPPATAQGAAVASAGGDPALLRGRHPRAALGVSSDRYIALVCDGYSLRDSGLTLDELQSLMCELGAEAVTILGGGASASLVSGGHLHNRPRDESGVALLYGRPVTTAIAFAFGR